MSSPRLGRRLTCSWARWSAVSGCLRPCRWSRRCFLKLRQHPGALRWFWVPLEGEYRKTKGWVYSPSHVTEEHLQAFHEFKRLLLANTNTSDSFKDLTFSVLTLLQGSGLNPVWSRSIGCFSALSLITIYNIRPPLTGLGSEEFPGHRSKVLIPWSWLLFFFHGTPTCWKNQTELLGEVAFYSWKVFE